MGFHFTWKLAEAEAQYGVQSNHSRQPSRPYSNMNFQGCDDFEQCFRKKIQRHRTLRFQVTSQALPEIEGVLEAFDAVPHWGKIFLMRRPRDWTAYDGTFIECVEDIG